MGDGNDFCGIGNLWTVDYSNAVLSTYLFLSAMLVSSGLNINFGNLVIIEAVPNLFLLA